MGLLDSFPTYEKTKKKKNSAKKSSKTSGQKNRVEYRHRNSSKSSKATTKAKKQVSSAKKKAKSSASSSGRRNQVEYRHRDTNASSESSLLSKELPVAKERKENTERDTALTPKMNLPYGNQKKPTTSASSASPKGFGDFRVAQREQEKNQDKPLNLQYLSSAITGNTRKDQGTGQKNAVSTALSMPSFSAERKEDTNRNTAAKTIAGPVDVSLKTITELGHEATKSRARERQSELIQQNRERLSHLNAPFFPQDATEKMAEKTGRQQFQKEIEKKAKEIEGKRWTDVWMGTPAIATADSLRGTVSGLNVIANTFGIESDTLENAKDDLSAYSREYNRQLERAVDDNKGREILSNFSRMGTDAATVAVLYRLGVIPGMAFTGIRTLGDSYDEAIASGATEEEAKIYAYANAGMTAALSRYGGERMMGNILRGSGDNLLRNILRTSAAETLEENIQNIFSNVAKEATYKDFDKVFSANRDEDAIVSLPQILETSAYSSVLGGLDGGISGLAGGARNTTPSPRASVTGNQQSEKPFSRVPNLSEIFSEFANRRNNQNSTADTTAADGGNSNMLVAPEQVNAYIDYAYTYGQSSVLPKQKSYLEIAKPSQRLIDDLQEDFDVSEYTHALRDNDIRHIRKQTNEKYPVTKQDLKQIPDIIENYDDVLFIPEGKKLPAIVFVKQHNGVTYYLEEAQAHDGKTKLLVNKQMIKVPTGTIPRIKQIREAIAKKRSTILDTHDNSDDTKVSPERTPYVSRNDASNNNIPDPVENINYVSAYKNKADQQVPDTPMGPQGDARNELPASAFNNSIPDSAGNINSFDGKDMETIKREYQEAVDDNITEFVERVLNNDFHPKEKMNIGKIPERSVRDISDIVHFDVNNYSTVIKPETIQHIVKRHGENGQQDHSMANIEDISRIRYVLDNYDIVEPNPGRITGYSDKNGKLAQSVRYIKRVNGNYYAVVAVPDTARKEMVIVTAYKNKADQQAPDATNGPRDYVRNVPLAESASNNNIPDPAENSNPLYTKRSEDIHQLLSSRLQLPSAREDDVFASVYSIPNSAGNSNHVSAYKNEADQSKLNAKYDPKPDVQNDSIASAFNNSIPDSAGNSKISASFMDGAKEITPEMLKDKALMKTKPKYSRNPKKWINPNGKIKGKIYIDRDGNWIYTDNEGNCVRYKNGYPDFKEAGLVKQEVNIGSFTTRKQDARKADKMASHGPKDANSVWHHSEDGKTMQEIDRDIHRKFTHQGGISREKRRRKEH